MKKYIFSIILATLILLEIIFMNPIKEFAIKIINNRPDLIILPSNNYTKHYDFMFVKQSTDYVPYSIGDIRNIYYSMINNGWSEFTFYCPTEYEECVKDVQTVSSNDTLLTNINNYTNPFNAFNSIETTYDDSGEINIKLDQLYDIQEINAINKKLDQMIKENITPNMSDEDKIKALHDYIINSTEYDKVRNDTGSSSFKSNTAYGALIENKAICSGYADAMSLLLDKLGIKNFKIASKTHVWNAVYINNQWLHLDLTWDDPVSERGPILDHKYFLITTDELVKADGDDIDTHVFDKTVYLEFNN